MFDATSLKEFVRKQFGDNHAEIESNASKLAQTGIKVGSIIKVCKQIPVTITHGRLRDKHHITIKRGQSGRVDVITKDGCKAKFTVVVKDTDHQAFGGRNPNHAKCLSLQFWRTCFAREGLELTVLMKVFRPRGGGEGGIAKPRNALQSWYGSICPSPYKVLVDVPFAYIDKSEPKANEGEDLGPRMPKGFEFARQPCKEVEVIEWPMKKGSDHTQALHTVKSSIGFLMGSMARQFPTYGSDDFLVIMRDKQTEVWTKRQFAPGTLVLCPETTEYKDRFLRQRFSNTSISKGDCLPLTPHRPSFTAQAYR